MHCPECGTELDYATEEDAGGGWTLTHLHCSKCKEWWEKKENDELVILTKDKTRDAS